jgi:para-aminobenzoate synthetase / 4-amino-4-deoxychorismate lyase
VSTPPADGRILPGVTRDLVLDSLPALGLAVEVGPVRLSDLRGGAAEVFVTSSIGGVRPVTGCDAGSWLPGPVTGAVDAAVERAWSGA